jgi:hypothetical protein
MSCRDGEIVSVALNGADVEITSRPDPNMTLTPGGDKHSSATAFPQQRRLEDPEVLEEAEEDEQGRKVYA